MTQASEDIPVNDDAPPVPECNPMDDDFKDDDDTTDVSVSGHARLRLGSDSNNYTEVDATSADLDDSNGMCLEHQTKN